MNFANHPLAEPEAKAPAAEPNPAAEEQKVADHQNEEEPAPQFSPEPVEEEDPNLPAQGVFAEPSESPLEEESQPEGKSEHRHRHHHHRKHKHKHHKKHGESAEGEIPGEEGEGEESGGTTGKKRRKKTGGGSKKGVKKSKEEAGDDVEQQHKIDEQVGELIQEIMIAAENDRESKAEGKLAIEKLKLLPKIRTELKKSHFHEPFLNKNGLEALYLWIQRHEDGTYPSLDILEGVIDICDELPITTDNLLENGRDLARTIKDISLNNESEELRVKAKRLVEKWSREIYGIETDYHNLSEKEHGYIQFLRHVNATRKKPQSPPREQPKGTADFEDVKTAPRRVNKTELPVKGTLAAISKVGFDFVQRPVSELVVERKREESNVNPLTKRMLQVKKEGRKKTTGTSGKYKDIS